LFSFEFDEFFLWFVVALELVCQLTRKKKKKNRKMLFVFSVILAAALGVNGRSHSDGPKDVARPRVSLLAYRFLFAALLRKKKKKKR
jgi:hypothetical protein